MKIRYNKKKHNQNLIFVTFWTILALLTFNYNRESRWMDYGYIVIAILFLGQYIYEYRNQYLTIENGIIRQNRFFGKKMELDKVIWIKKSAGGDYILKTDSQELSIHTKWIDEKSILELNSVLGKLDLPSEKTPFANMKCN